jgi:membrane fusion protein, multidrug efflux system
MNSIRIGLIACALLTLCNCRPAAPPPAPPPPQVTVLTITPESVTLTTELPGRTAPYRKADIRPRVNGLILERCFEEGSSVTNGQLLYRIDPAPYAAALQSAEASLARAKATARSIQRHADRLADLYAEALISPQDHDEAEAAAAAAQAEIRYWQAAAQQARINLDYTQLTAPIPGRIGKSHVTEGCLVTAYQPLPLTTVHQLDPIYVDVPQSTRTQLDLRHLQQAGRLQTDTAAPANVQLTLPDGSAYTAKGTIQFQDVAVQPTTGTTDLRILFPNPDQTLLPGMFVRATIERGTEANAILVPQQCVYRNAQGEPLVWLIDTNETARPQPVQIERALADQWLIAKGLQAGDRIVFEGSQRLRPGAPVQALPHTPAPEQKAPPG